MKISRYLIAATILVSLGFASCTRDYTCQCHISYTGKPGLPDSMLNEYIIKDTRDNAKKLCEENSNTTQANGITAIEDCTLF